MIKTVKGQQQMTQSEDSTVSGESKFVVPEATSQNEVLPHGPRFYELVIICFRRLISKCSYT